MLTTIATAIIADRAGEYRKSRQASLTAVRQKEYAMMVATNGSSTLPASRERDIREKSRARREPVLPEFYCTVIRVPGCVVKPCELVA
jgi:hypothetical protein